MRSAWKRPAVRTEASRVEQELLLDHARGSSRARARPALRRVASAKPVIALASDTMVAAPPSYGIQASQNGAPSRGAASACVRAVLDAYR
jgi:hypothetical protein